LETIAVKIDRPLAPAPRTGLRTGSTVDGWTSAWTRFWFTAIPPLGLHWVRVLSGLLFLGWLLPFAGHQTEIFGQTGWLDQAGLIEVVRFPAPGGAPASTGWSLLFLCGENATLVHALWLGAIAVFLLFTLGVATRITSVLTWLFVISFSTNPAAQFDADFLLVILAFYLMIGYLLLGQWHGDRTPRNILVCNRGTFLSPWNKSCNAQPSYAANLALRLIQVHFAIIVVASCLHKLQFGDWWSGVALFYPLHNPFEMSAERLRAVAEHRDSLLFFLSLAQYAMLAWQLAFPVFAWRPRWRWLLLAGGVLGWVGCIFISGEPVFGPFYLIGCLSFLTAAEWQAATAWLAGLTQGFTGGVKATPDKKVSVRG
jgi:hypothetical protein